MTLSPSIFTDVINSYLPEPHASLMNGILFGIPLKTSRLFYQQLKTVGLLHIVVLSGMNITILAAIIGVLTTNLGKKVSIMITILFVIVFVFFVGPEAPIIRAGIMGILTLVAFYYGRKNTALYALLISAIVLLIFWPKMFNTISFQLSYGATLGIILWGNTKIKDRQKNFIGRSIYSIWKELKLSFAAQIFTVPIIFLHFKEISFIAPLSNILISFVIPPLMVFGFLTVILGKIHFWLGILPSYILYGLLSYIILVVDLLSKITFGYLKL